MSFNCFRCSKNFATNQSLKRHYNRKNKCIGVEKLIFDENGYPKSIILAKNKYPKSIIVLEKNSKNTKTKNTMKIDKNSDSKIKCEFCGAIFTYKNNLYRHQKKCSKKIENDKKVKIKELENKILELEDKLKDLENFKGIMKQNVTNNYNNYTNIGDNNNINIQNNNQFNLTINGFGKENLESITKKEIIEILNKRFEAFPAALEKIYTIPENQNFYLPNKRDKKYIKVFDGTKAYYEDSNDFMYKLSNKIMNQLENWFKTHNKHIKVQRRKLMEHVFDIFNDGQLYERYKKEIDKFLMNYSNSVKLVFEQNIQNIRNQISIIENS